MLHTATTLTAFPSKCSKTWARWSESLCFVDLHDNSWFIDVVPINMLSCHRQHINSIRHGWHFCSQFSLLNYFIVWIVIYSGLCMSILRSLNLYNGWFLAIIFVYSMVGWVICHLILFRVLIKRVSGFTVSDVCAYETMFFHGTTVTMRFPRQCNVMQLKSFIVVLTPRNNPWQLVGVCTSNRSPPGMILPLVLLLKHWIEHVTIGLLYVKFIV